VYTGKQKETITKGKVLAADVGYSTMDQVMSAILFGTSLWGVYYVNTNWSDEEESNKIIFGNIATIALALITSSSLLLGWKKLKLKFYKDERTIEQKHEVIRLIKKTHHWRLEKEDVNYYVFFEDNLITTSYFITVVIDEAGFYLNCYPDKNRVLDFGKSTRWCEELAQIIYEYK
jgi:hypothetical protein